MDDDLAPSAREEKMGFTLQTLSYPEKFELKKLGRRGKERFEKAIAIILDDDNRLKRSRLTRGYLHERREMEGWRIIAVYSDLDELELSPVYADYRDNLPQSINSDEKEE